MARVHLALFWHHHQPYYVDPRTGRSVLPWVRLHAVKDYYGMAKLVSRHPRMRVNINLVPSLVEQIEMYADGRLTDEFLEAARVPAADLTEQQALFLLDNFFLAPFDKMIRPYSRYRELYSMRRLGRVDAHQALKKFSERDLRDLQVWHNLIWFHPLSVSEEPVAAELLKKGGNFSEEEKDAVLKLQREIIKRVIPLHRKLEEDGAIELTTTPYYHPILPLLIDTELARIAMPGCRLPANRASMLDDARAQLARAVQSHERHFGRKPRGLWPSEGSVCSALIPLAAEAGFEWMATDEDILAHTLTRRLRSASGRVERPDLLYAAHLAEYEDSSIPVVFRDHVISDLIGFAYRSRPAKEAAEDLLSRIRAAGKRSRDRPVLFVIALDGENAWEHYDRQGVDFLEAFYSGVERAEDIEPVRIGDYIREHPPASKLNGLYPGSWINHDFFVWMGTQQDVKAWEAVLAARGALFSSDAPEEEKQRALESLFIAEGSDWYWWFGDDRSSMNDREFDSLFRARVKDVYRQVGLTPPSSLNNPISGTMAAKAVLQPRSFLDVIVDGKVTHFFEWLGAGEVERKRGGGAMAKASGHVVRKVYFGFAPGHLFVRVDFAREPEDGELELALASPTEVSFRFRPLRPGKISARVRHGDGAERDAGSGVEAVMGSVLELALPLAYLASGSSDAKTRSRPLDLEFFLRYVGPGGGKERLPEEGLITVGVPEGSETGPEAGRAWSGGGSSAMSELRKDPVLGRWVIIASERARRPTDFVQEEERVETGFCPFCEGNESKTPPEIVAVRKPGTKRNSPGWTVRVVPNKFPALRVEGHLNKRGVGMYDMMGGVGAHEVVVECPQHERDFTALPHKHIATVLKVCRDRALDLRRDKRLVCPMIFKNVGRIAGASLEHTHTQIIVTPVVPRTVQQEMEGCRKYYDYRGRCLFCDMVEQETHEGERMVFNGERLVAFEPFASKFPFETWVVPNAHLSHFEECRDEVIDELAFVLTTVLRKLNHTLKNPPYNLIVHTSPFTVTHPEHYHWHVEIIPRLTKVAGFEWGTGFYINPVPPETAAGFLREAEGRRMKDEG